MKKKIAMIVLSGVLALNLSACAVGNTGLSDGELKQVAEYAAKLVLKHTRNYEPTLQEELAIKENPGVIKEEFDVAGNNAEQQKESRSPVKEEQKDGEDEKETSDINATNGDDDTVSSLSSIYDASGFEVVYGGAGEYSRYPKNEGYFSLVAADDMKLYVVEFSIRNTTNKNKKFSQGSEVGYNLTFDGEHYYKPSLTLLENDMQSLDISVGGGQSAKGVVVFNVPKKADKNKAKLKVMKGSKSYTLHVTQ